MSFKENTIIAKTLTPMKDVVFVTDLDSGVKKSAGGIIITDDNMKDRGIRERWAKVHSVGTNITDIKPGEYVLLQHGRWTHGFDTLLDGEHVTLWRIDYPEAVILVSDVDPRTTTNAIL
jgi:co-chaperonin GroES (HSP10)